MNYYNPYINFIPYTVPAAKPSLLSSIFKSGRFSLGSILNGTQKALGFINQAIPVVKQVSPMVKNAKTMFKVMNEFKKVDNNEKNINNSKNTNENKTSKSMEQYTEIKDEKNNGLTFFM